MKRYIIHWALLAVVLIAALVIGRPANPFNHAQIKVTVPAGASARSVAQLLRENKLLPGGSPFLLAVKLFGLAGNLKAGDYYLSPADPLPAVLYKLAAGQTVPPDEIRVAFPEGASIYRMGLILKEHGFKRWAGFQRLVDEGIGAGLRERHWGLFKYVPSESLEGYLFPDTYNVYADASPEALAEIMLKRFEAVVVPFWEKAKRDTKLTLHEVLTLASIVEKEARKPEERPVIASVFYNRLKLGMPLAADPTVKYALERPSKIVYLDQLSVKSPYNTYKRRGLPPGPICNPGLDSIKAAVYPAKTNYLFFVAKKDGSHSFSKTWQEHQRARLKAL
ncbi:MAG: endolytic transglycosylase MltG [Candidatus Saganbacteria bacterium]|nr:endolytic transglycosylase MltG [Candidatus Saganbacteria bacterium]